MLEELDELAVPIYSDERGRNWDFQCFPVEGLHVATVQPGAVRGNHVHDRDEIMCVVGGDGICQVFVEDEVSRGRKNIVVTGDVKTYRIKAGIKHIVSNVGDNPFYLICFHEALSKSLQDANVGGISRI